MMEGAFLSPPAKRSFQNLSTMQDNGGGGGGGASKRRSKPMPQPMNVPPGHAALRFLCQASKIGGVIGKSGSVVQLVRQETGAKIRIDEPVPGCDERVILIIAPENPKKKVTLKGVNEEDGEVHELSAAQEALVKVFEKVLDVDAETEGLFPPAGGVVSCRLLAASGQIGSVMGKGGKIIEKIRNESGAKVRVLPPEQLPACADDNDEVIQMMGDILAVKKALVAISHCLQLRPPLERGQMVVNIPAGTASYQTFSDPRADLSRDLPNPRAERSRAYPDLPGEFPRTFPDLHGELSRTFPDPHRELPRTFSDPHRDFSHRGSISSGDYASRGRTLSLDGDRTFRVDPKVPEQEVSFKLLCSNEKAGGVIGKGGTIVRALQNETGASISVASPVSESDERVITITASENPESRHSPAQNAVVRVFSRSVEVGTEKGLENRGSPVTARILVPSNQIGSLIGKGGSIVSEMRKATSTSIRIIGGDQVPKCASENEDVVQIVGEFRNVQDALYHVTGRLRDNLFPNQIMNGPGARSYSSSTAPEISSYGRARETSSPGMYPPAGISHNHDRQSTLAQRMDHLGISHNTDRPPSSRIWSSQRPNGGDSSLRSTADVGREPTTFRGGLELGSASKSVIVTNTTVDIVVPDDVIGFVYGENGSNLNRLRQISGAKVVVHDPRPGTREGMVIISGTPDQTQAAQSLLQAFIINGRSSSPDHRSQRL